MQPQFQKNAITLDSLSLRLANGPILPSESLLPVNYQDPNIFGVKSADTDVAIGLASVITKEQKKHNRANNEDAASCFVDKQSNLRIISIADMHDGYLAGQEAVLQFPDCLVKAMCTKQDQDPRQNFLEAVMDLCIKVNDIGRSSGLTYPVTYPNGLSTSLPDRSTGQFFSVIDLAGKHYFVGLGDCSCNIIRNDQIIPVKSRNTANGIVGGLAPNIVMREFAGGPGLDRNEPMPFNNPRVRNGIDVVELETQPGDVILLSSDGYTINNIKPNFKLTELFKSNTVADSIKIIMEEVQITGSESYRDNVSIAAMRV